MATDSTVKPVDVPGTYTTATFTAPAAAATVAIVVRSTGWLAVNDPILIAGQHYVVTAVADGSNMTVRNSGVDGNAVAGSITSPAQIISARGAVWTKSFAASTTFKVPKGCTILDQVSGRPGAGGGAGGGSGRGSRWEWRGGGSGRVH